MREKPKIIDPFEMQHYEESLVAHNLISIGVGDEISAQSGIPQK
jgi:hypothetical protein